MRRKRAENPIQRIPSWAETEVNGVLLKREGPAVTIDSLNRTDEDVCRWDGATDKGEFVTARFHRRMFALEVDGKFALRAYLPEGWPGMGERSLSNAGVKQLMMVTDPPIYLPF